MRQAHASKGVVVGQLGVGEAADSVGLVVHVLPVSLEPWGAGGQGPKQEGVQLVDDLLVDAGLKFAGEESRPGGLLWREKAVSQSERSQRGL